VPPSTGPTFFLVGNPKSGTTTLDSLLRQHPDLFLCAKDTHHFADDLDEADHGPFRPSSWREHVARFADAGPGQVLGEASACYTVSAVAIENIAARVPDARIVVVFREPVAFVRSWHLQLLRDPRLETVRDLEVALILEPTRRAGRGLPRRCALPQLLAYAELVRYAEQLARIRRSFPEQQIHVILYDDLVADPQQTLSCTFAFLGVDPAHMIDVEHRNLGVITTSSRIEDLRNRVIAGRDGDARSVRLASRLLYSLPEDRLHAMNRQAKRVLHRPPPPLDPRLARRLRDRFRPEVIALGDALGIDLLARWGYDHDGPQQCRAQGQTERGDEGQ
jgi:hypothetical protein